MYPTPVHQQSTGWCYFHTLEWRGQLWVGVNINLFTTSSAAIGSLQHANSGSILNLAYSGTLLSWACLSQTVHYLKLISFLFGDNFSVT